MKGWVSRTAARGVLALLFAGVFFASFYLGRPKDGRSRTLSPDAPIASAPPATTLTAPPSPTPAAPESSSGSGGLEQKLKAAGLDAQRARQIYERVEPARREFES